MSATPTGGAGDGSSWGDPYVGSDGLHAALVSATPGSEVWITAGTYLPSMTGDRFEAFEVSAADVTLRGGFLGSEATLFERPPRGTNPTLLSGDLLGNDDGSTGSGTDNSQRVCWFTGRGGTIENLEFAGGGPPGTSFASFGFAVVATPTSGSASVPNDFVVDGCVFRDCFGHGIAQAPPSGSPTDQTLTVFDSTFRQIDLAGVFLATSLSGSLDVDRCRFETCATAVRVTDRWSPATAVRNTVIRNCGTGVSFEPGLMAIARGALIQGCTIVGNGFAGVRLPAPTFSGEEVLVRNSIVRANGEDISSFVRAEHSIVGGGAIGVGVIDVDPQFMDLAGGVT